MRPCLLPTGVLARRWLRIRARREKRPSRHKSHQQRSTCERMGMLGRGGRESCRQRWNFLPHRSNQGRRNRLLIPRFARTYRRARTPGGSRQGRLLYDRTSYRRQKSQLLSSPPRQRAHSRSQCLILVRNRWRCPIVSRNRPRSPICRQSPIPSRSPKPTRNRSRPSSPSLSQRPSRLRRWNQRSQPSSSLPSNRRSLIRSRSPTPIPSRSRSSSLSLNQHPSRRHRRNQRSQRSSSPTSNRPNRHSRPQVA